ncbi:MAG: radical SAM protein [Oscillospiraceae bacterium]|jgi:MoaA/NifB/PqqE/SkfB family radical SAM enzyme|nr:radical SAM protein [Oscillospiraceae bacterium]
MADFGLKEQLEKFGIKKALGYLGKDPDQNIPKLLDMIDKFDKDDMYKGQREMFHRFIDNPENNWFKLIKKLYATVDLHVLQTIFANFIVNATLIGGKKQETVRKKYGCNVPWTILLDPTSACNLHCTGCWAAEYGNKLNLSFDEIDDIINQGTSMGTYMYIYTGGEPLVRKDDIIKLCEKHNDCVFLCFTNATLIDDKFAEDMLRVGNFVPAISVEGTEASTDARRGKGTFQKVIHAMEILRNHRLPFGVSCCYTSQNVDAISDEKFFDWLIDQDALFAWFFTYMPIGTDAPTDLMVPAEKREFMYHQIRKFRETKELFTMDFFLDGEYVYGCIAGGRYYLHINANGDIDPCVFIHYSDSNIHDKTLLEAYCSPLFMEYHKHQPFNENMLRPCPLLDNPYKLEEVVKATDAHSTDLVKKEDVHDLCAKCEARAKEWQPVADRLWVNSEGNKHGLGCENTILPQNRIDHSKVRLMRDVIKEDIEEDNAKIAAKKAAQNK